MTRIDPRFLTGLNDEDHVMCLGDDEWHTVGELRAAASARKPELRTNTSIEENNVNTPAPDPYAADIARLRAAAGMTEHDATMAAQIAQIEAAAAGVAAENAEAFRALADEPSDLSAYRAPDSYREGLLKLRNGQ